MGLLDQVIGGVLGQVFGGGRGQPQGGGGQGSGGHGSGGMGGGGMLGGAMSPIVQALLMLLVQKGMSGGFGDIFGGGARQAPQDDARHDTPPRHRDDGDLGGFGQDRDRSGGRRDEGGGEFGDLAGMLDGTGGGSSSPAGHESGLESGSGDDSGAGHGGLDDLMDRFQRGGLGDVMESWIGPGRNKAVEPHHLADALGPRTVDALASRTGLDRDTLLSQLAQVLPGVIDGLTPQGRRPSPEDRRRW